MRDLEGHPGDMVITFTTAGATCSGFNLIKQHEDRFGLEEANVVAALRSLVGLNRRQQLQFTTMREGYLGGQQHALAEVRKRLPSGSGPLLPSIGEVEYAAFRTESNRFALEKNAVPRPERMMEGPIRHPMVPLKCEDTFASVDQFVAESSFAAAAGDAESTQAMKLWATKAHRGAMYFHGNFAILAVNFRAFPRLQSVSDSAQYRLPKQMATEARFDCNGIQMKTKAFLMSTTPPLPSHDAFFMIVSHTKDDFTSIMNAADQRPSDNFLVHFTPHNNSFTYGSQLQTIAELQKSKNERWHRILLNQAHDAIEEVDLTKDIDPKLLAEADEFLLNWMNWNAEQLQVIEGLKRAKGGLIIVMGPAGTGKTSLQQALAIYFYYLGFHILALAPANSNANHLAAQTYKLILEGRIKGLDISRLFPGSRDVELENMNEKQAKHRKVGHKGGSASVLRELYFALAGMLPGDANTDNTHSNDRRTKKGSAYEYGVVQQVIRATEAGTLTLEKRDEDGEITHHDAWETLRQCITAYREDKLYKKGYPSKEECRIAYNACKGHIVGLCRFLITTTGNVRSQEMLEHFYSKEERYGVPRLGVMVFIDEAAKDVEVNVWAGIVCEQWASDVRGVFMFGDVK